MKNPWMSAWLSAANRTAGTARGLGAAEMGRQQATMTKAWTEAATAFWLAPMTFWMPPRPKRRK